MKKTLLALILAVSSLLAVSAGAEEAAAEQFPPVIEGYKALPVTSSISSFPGITEKIDTSLIFDNNSQTGCTVEFIDVAESEKAAAEEAGLPVADEKTVSIYTSSGVPHGMLAFALNLQGDMGTAVSINVYGTNDNLQLDWTQLNLTSSRAEENNGYYVFEIDGKIEKYSFYRFDISLTAGNVITINEIELYKSAKDIFEYHYATGSDIEPGETPEIERVLIEKPKSVKKYPMFGLTNLPGAVRPVPYK
ncbi:MAG: hypothetical protein IKI93_03285 [Clostridia bacterium]|nr:hypothetical protein [Clostridia bacterium]